MPTTGIQQARCKQNLSFVDARRGFLGAWARDVPAVIYRTADGGATWQSSAQLPYPPGVTAGPGATMSVGHVRGFGNDLLVEAVSSSAGRPVAAMYRSADAGATWSVIAVVPEQGAALVSVRRWIRLLGPGDSQETTDAGATWHAFATDYQQAAPIAPAVIFADANVGYATVRGSIQRTIDGGTHWTPVRTPGT